MEQRDVTRKAEEAPVYRSVRMHVARAMWRVTRSAAKHGTRRRV